MHPNMSNFKDNYIPILCLIKKYSHTVAYKANTHRAYEKSQHAEDFGCIKLNLLLKIHITVLLRRVSSIHAEKMEYLCVMSQTR